MVGSNRRPRIFTVENIGLAAQHGYISPAAELSWVFTPPFETVPNDIQLGVFRAWIHEGTVTQLADIGH
jgi:hypothetical protein